MQFEENYLTKNQEKIAEKVIKAVEKQLNIKSPDCTILGLNPSQRIEELKEGVKYKTNKEIKKTEKYIKSTKKKYDKYVKIVFNLGAKLKKLVFMTAESASSFFGLESTTVYDSWTGLLDFSIPAQIIFGRIAKRPRHGFGSYLFAPLNFPTSDLLEKIEQKSQQNNLDNFLLTLTSANPLIKFLSRIRQSKQAFDQMRTMRQLIKSKEPSGIEIIDKLNMNRILKKTMKSLSHFGNTSDGIIKYVSEVDVSTLCLPMQVGTFLQIANYRSEHDKSVKATTALVDALNELT